MALRLSRQSSCKGFDEHPLRRHRAFTDPEGPMNIRMTRTYLLFTISYRTGSHPANRQAPANFCFHDVFGFGHTYQPQQPEPWWSRTGSNRRPPACKAGALPAELRPLKVWQITAPCRCARANRPEAHSPHRKRWWAWEDLNLRPHAYQARALTN